MFKKPAQNLLPTRFLSRSQLQVGPSSHRLGAGIKLNLANSWPLSFASNQVQPAGGSDHPMLSCFLHQRAGTMYHDSFTEKNSTGKQLPGVYPVWEKKQSFHRTGYVT
jgi:hypothetical protein